MNRKGSWEGYRRQAKRLPDFVSPVVSFPPSFACTSRETSGYEAGPGLFPLKMGGDALGTRLGFPISYLVTKSEDRTVQIFRPPPCRSFLQGWGGESSAHLAFGEFSPRVYGSLYFNSLIL